MIRPVFISYARTSSRGDAGALAAKLGDLAFLDTSNIEDGDYFPQRLIDGILGARIIVIFATSAYSQSRFCRLEMHLALAAGESSASHLVLTLGHGSQAVLDRLPPEIAGKSWPESGDTGSLEDLVRRHLDEEQSALSNRLNIFEAKKACRAFLEGSSIPEAVSLGTVKCSFPFGSNIHSIGAQFVGRGWDLRRLHDLLHNRGHSPSGAIVRITAGAGFGKTRLAAEYIYRYGLAYPGGVFWVDASSVDIEGELWRVLGAIRPGQPEISVMREQGRDIRRELERALRAISEPVLYVIDNIPETPPDGEPNSPAEFCPALGAVAVLITSRQDTRDQGVKILDLPPLPHDSAICLLSENVPSASTLSWNEWGLLTEWLGDLPLALDILNRSLGLGSISPRQLLDQLRSHAQNAVLEIDRLREALRGQVGRQALPALAQALLISYEALDAPTRVAAEFCAQFAPEPIPEECMCTLPSGVDKLSVRAELRARHFVTGGSSTSFGTMHRITSAFLRTISTDRQAAAYRDACGAVVDVMTKERCEDPSKWPLMNLCRLHAEDLFRRGLESGSAESGVAQLGLAVAFLALEQGSYRVARDLQEKVISMRGHAAGEYDRDVLWAKSGLVASLRAEGNFETALELAKDVLQAYTELHGRQHEDSLLSMNDLGSLLYELGEYNEARTLQQEALMLCADTLGEDHSTTLAAMVNLAETLWEMGDRVESKRLQNEELALRMRKSGEEHPATLIAMNNVALNLQSEGNYAAARQMQEKVLEVRTRLLGDRHPFTLQSVDNLASTMRLQGEIDGSVRLRQAALELSLQTLGMEHPDTLTLMGNLASSLRSQGDCGAARDLYERVLAVRKGILGENHPRTIISMNNLADLLREQGDLAAARQIQESVVVTSKSVFGEKHPNTLTFMGNLAGTLVSLNDLSGARGLQEVVVEARREICGVEHVDTLRALHNLACTLCAQGDSTGSAQLHAFVLETRKRILGENHPDTVISMAKLRELSDAATVFKVQ